MADTLEVRVDIHKGMYPRLFAILEGTPPRMRAEKVRQLASMSEMIEGGLIDGVGNILAKKLSQNTMEASVKEIGSIKEEGNSNPVDPSDYADFD